MLRRVVLYRMLYVGRYVRKQVYLEDAQERRLKRRARAEGVPEAEIIRRAIDLGLERLAGPATSGTKAGREGFFKLVRKLIEQGAVPGRRRWTREELYDR